MQRLPHHGAARSAVQRGVRAAQHYLWWWAGLLTLALLTFVHPAFVERLNLLAYDLIVPTVTAAEQAPLVIAIDDASLAELGRWPWPRSRYVPVIEGLREAGAAAVGLDVLFSEPDLSDPDGDTALATAITRNGRVVLPVAPSQTADRQNPPAPLSAVTGFLGKDATVGRGHVDVEVDLDGQARRLYLYAGYGRAEVPALALAVRQRVTPELERTQLPGVSSGQRAQDSRSVWLRDREVLLPRMHTLPSLSFAAVMRDPGLLSQARGRAVFIGVTAAGLGGELVTPLTELQSPLPAVEFHALAYTALAQQGLMQRTSAVFALGLSLLLVSSLVVWPRSDGRTALLAIGLLVLPLIASAALLFLIQRWFAPATATLVLAVELLGWLSSRMRVVRRQLTRSRQHALATLSAIGDAVITVEIGSRAIWYANPVALMQAGRQSLQGMTLREGYPLMPESQLQLESALDQCIAQLAPIKLADDLILQVNRADLQRTLRAAVSPLYNPEGSIEGAVIVLSDVTVAVLAARTLDYTATHDTLTGLANRALLEQRLAQAIARAQRSGNCAALLFLDLDRFKRINDSLGHRTGDEVLRVVGQRLSLICRETDTVARWGGDEFALLLEGLSDQHSAALAAVKLVDSLSQDIQLDAHYGHVRLPSAVSVGVVMLPQDGTTIDELLSKADMAMYRAKAQPQASFQFWSEDLNTRMHARLGLDVDLRQGLRDEQFVLHYQPQVAFGDGRLVGMEALMRWQRAPGELVMPGEFIAVAEDSGLIVDLGAWAVLEAARQVARWLAAGLQPVPVAVNVSARQCLNLDIVQVVRLALRETGIPPSLLRLEITESAAMTDADQVIGLLRAIRALGVGLVMDDFGTGFSSLSYLKHFPLDELKIDRSFVSAITSDKTDVAIVQATIALAHCLDLKVVAEGVETDAQSRLLNAEGCDIAQGYLFGRPESHLDAIRRL